MSLETSAAIQALAAAVQASALVVAGVFYLLRSRRGHFVTNLRVGLETARLPAGDAYDHLGVKVTLTKGSLGGLLEIQDARILVESPIADFSESVELREIRRFERLEDIPGFLVGLRGRIRGGLQS